MCGRFTLKTPMRRMCRRSAPLKKTGGTDSLSPAARYARPCRFCRRHRTAVTASVKPSRSPLLHPLASPLWGDPAM